MYWLDKQITDFFECCALSRRNRIEALMYLLVWSLVMFAAVNTAIAPVVLVLAVVTAHAVCLKALNKVAALVVFGPLVTSVKLGSLALHGLRKAFMYALTNVLYRKDV